MPSTSPTPPVRQPNRATAGGGGGGRRHLEIEVEGGLTLWTRPALSGAGGALASEAITDRGLELTGLPGPSIAERGVKDWFTGALRVLRLKADDLAEQLKDPKSWRIVSRISRLARWKNRRLGHRQAANVSD